MGLYSEHPVGQRKPETKDKVMAYRRSRVFLAALMVLLAILGAVGLWLLRQSSHFRPTGDITSTGAYISRGWVKATPAPWELEPIATESSGALEGIVLDPDGNAAKGAEVTLGMGPDPSFLFNQFSSLQPTARVTAGELGRFRVEGLAPGNYSATATLDGLAPALENPIAIQRQNTTHVELRLTPGGVLIHGHIQDEGGGMIPAANVTFAPSKGFGLEMNPFMFQTLANSDGRYRITLGPGTYQMEVRAEGYAPFQDFIDLFQATKKNVRLVPAGRLSGQVVERATGKPVANAEVGLDSARRFEFIFPRRTKSDSLGHFDFSNLGPGSYELTARSKTHVSMGKVISLAVAESAKNILLSMDRGYAIRGRVVDDRGEGLSGISIAAIGNGISLGIGNTVQTHSGIDGTFALEGLPPQSYYVQAKDELDRFKRVHIKLDEKDSGDVRIVLPSTAKLSGKVTTGDGKSVQGVKVVAKLSVTESVGASGIHTESTLTAADGSFHFPKVAPAGVTLEARHDKVGIVQEGPYRVQAGEEKFFHLILSSGGSVAGTVKAENGKPAAGITVEFESPQFFPTARSHTDSDGHYLITGLPAGEARVQALRTDADRYVDWGSPNQKLLTLERDEKKTGIDLKVKVPGDNIQGIVLGPDQKPIAGAIIRAGLKRLGLPDFQGLETAKAFSEIDGRFTLDGLDQATYNLKAAHPLFPDAILKNILAGKTNVTLQFAFGASIAGVVVNRHAIPLTHYNVMLLPNSPASSIFEASVRRVQDPQGAFEITQLAAGTYDLIATAPSGESAKQEITLTTGEKKTGIRLTTQAALHLAGRVLEHGTLKPIPDVEVSIVGPGGTLSPLPIQANGSFASDHIPVTEPMVFLALSESHEPIHRPLSIPPGQTELDMGTVLVHPKKPPQPETVP